MDDKKDIASSNKGNGEIPRVKEEEKDEKERIDARDNAEHFRIGADMEHLQGLR